MPHIAVPRTTGPAILRLRIVASLLALGWLLLGGGAVLAQTPEADAAVDIATPSTTDGALGAAGERDFYRFPASAGEALSIRVELGSLPDSTLEILDTDGLTSLAFNDDSGSLASALVFLPPATGDFFAVVAGFADAFGSYTLIVEEAGDLDLGAGPRFVDSSFTVFGDIAGDQLAASATGDFNDDGIPDLGLGAPGALLGDGRVVIMPGPFDAAGDGAELTQLALAGGVSLPGEIFSRSGTALAAGDFSRDGIDDLAVASDFGLQLVLGAPGLFDAEAPVPLFISIEDEVFAIPALAAGDLNADGWTDLAYALPGADTAAVGLLFGPFDISDGITAFPAARGRIDAPAGDFAFGRLLAAGDLTGDGRDDLAIAGSALDDDGFNLGPRITVLAGPFGPEIVSADDFVGPPAVDFEAFFPSGLAVGDADLDGQIDLLIGDAGLLIVVPARVIEAWRFPFANIMASDVRDIESSFGFPFFGADVSLSVGDLDGDGLPDILVGAAQDAPPFSGAGAGSVSLFPDRLRPAALDGAVPAVLPAGDQAVLSLRGRALRDAAVALIVPDRLPVEITDVVMESNGSMRIAIPAGLGPGSYGVRVTTPDGEIETEDVFQLTPSIREVTLGPGWDVAGWSGATPITEALASFSGQIDRVLGWNAQGQAFNSYAPRLPAAANTLTDVAFGDGLWLNSPEGGIWQQPIRLGANVVPLFAGFNLVMWRGPALPVAEAVASLGDALNAAFLWQAASERFRQYRPALPAGLRDDFPLQFGDTLWIDAAAQIDWVQPQASVGIAPQPPLAAASPDVEQAVVIIQTDVASGSGFVISGTEILTNAHVVGGFRSVLVRFADGTEVRGYVSAVDGALDVAVVRVARMPESARRLDWQTAPTPRLTDDILAWGFPGGEVFGEDTSATVTRGIISAIRVEDGFSNIQLDLFIAPGSSGGPIVLPDGRVVGISDFAVFMQGYALNFGINVTAHRDRIRTLLQQFD